MKKGPCAPFSFAVYWPYSGVPGVLTVPADDMQTERPNEYSHVRNYHG
jgi:hypothetical protein